MQFGLSACYVIGSSAKEKFAKYKVEEETVANVIKTNGCNMTRLFLPALFTQD